MHFPTTRGAQTGHYVTTHNTKLAHSGSCGCELTTLLLLVEDHVLQDVAVHRWQSVVRVHRRPVVDVGPGPVVSLLENGVGRGVSGVVGALLAVRRQVVGGARPASLAVPEAHSQSQHAEVVCPGQAQGPHFRLLPGQQVPHAAGAQLPQSGAGHVLQLLLLPRSRDLNLVGTLALHPVNAVDEVLGGLEGRADIAYHVELLKALHGWELPTPTQGSSHYIDLQVGHKSPAGWIRMSRQS